MVVVLSVVVVCVWCVLRHAEKMWKNPCVDSKTPPCVHSKRRRVCRNHAHMCFNMCACGDVLNLHMEGVLYIYTEEPGVIVSSANQNLPTYGCHVLQRFTKETFESFPFSSLRTD